MAITRRGYRILPGAAAAAALAAVAVSACAASDGEGIEQLADQPSAPCPSPGELVAPSAEPSTIAYSSAIRVGVILLDYANVPLACDRAAVDGLVFGASGSLRQVFEQSSAGRATIDGDVLGPFSLPYRHDDLCTPLWFPLPFAGVWDSLQHLAAAGQIAREHGIDLDQYDRLIVMVPEKAWWCQTVPIGLPFGSNKGAAILSDSEALTWFSGRHACEHAKLVAHEFGHTSGFDHAGDVGGEYGDLSDNMGAPSAWLPEGYEQLPPVQYDAVRKLQIGWWEPDQVAQPAPGTTVVYEIQANAADPATGRPAIVELPVADSIDGDAYHVSYRAPIGLDANLEPRYHNKVQIHRSGGPPIPGVLFDRTFLHASLGAHEAYVDAAFTVDVLDVADTYARVRVTRKPLAERRVTCPDCWQRQWPPGAGAAGETGGSRAEVVRNCGVSAWLDSCCSRPHGLSYLSQRDHRVCACSGARRL